jgi:hypothetical protein
VRLPPAFFGSSGGEGYLGFAAARCGAVSGWSNHVRNDTPHSQELKPVLGRNDRSAVSTGCPAFAGHDERGIFETSSFPGAQSANPESGHCRATFRVCASRIPE